jgi:hypothetical protein
MDGPVKVCPVKGSTVKVVVPVDGFAVGGFALHPVDPEEPAGAVGPVAPVDRAAPVDPVDPVEPVAPVDPVAPDDPVEPVDPVAPVDPDDPVEPVGPDAPVGPVHPVGGLCGCRWFGAFHSTRHSRPATKLPLPLQ